MGQVIHNRFNRNLLRLERICLDSMCFIYQFTGNKLYSPLTNNIVSLLEQNKIKAITSVVTVVEIFVHEEKMSDALTIKAYEQTFLTIPNLEIIPIDWNIARFASKFRAKYSFLKTPDALQIATTLLKGCNGFITNDAKLKKVKELKVISLADYI